MGVPDELWGVNAPFTVNFPPDSQMPGQKGKRSERQCVDGCLSTNSRTIAKHKREWQSSSKVKVTKLAAGMSRLETLRTRELSQDVGGPSNQEEFAVTRDSRATGRRSFSPMSSSPHPCHATDITVDNELARVESDPLSDSENLASASLSAYDCDSKGEAVGNDIDSEGSDSEVRGARKPGLMNLKFQLDAAKAGERCGFHLIDSTVDRIAQPGIASTRLTWTTFVRSTTTSAKGPPMDATRSSITRSHTRSPWHHAGGQRNALRLYQG